MKPANSQMSSSTQMESSLGVTLSPIKTLAEIEKNHIIEVLSKCNGNKTKTAKSLDISIKTLYNKMHEYGLMND